MTRILHRPRRDETPLLAAYATTRTAPIATTLPPLPLDAPARSVGVLRDLRGADGLLGMQRPAAPAPRPANPFAWQTATAALVHTLAVAYDDTADELELALAELAELAPFTAKAVADR